ncbi:MAG TPA: hypothetical protein P5328_02275 [Candidatus Paceibacterota bacterium]|nr:hypothetical protein [Candidatus Paceibacterota bacterium]HRZ34421.1 hypothetical protein [Candidatus Paceibacterota bacterium]
MVEDIYTDPKEAVAELKRRQKNPELIKKVEEYLKGDIPEPLVNFLEKPKMVLFRNIFTPDYELDIFLKYAKEIGAQPILFEYTDDMFVAKNEDKYALGKLMFYLNTDKEGHVNTKNLKIIDFNDSERKNIRDIKTLWGESLVDFHHRILAHFFSDKKLHIYDCSAWFHRNGGHPDGYYYKIFSLFICHAIMFENFRSSGTEGEFFRKIFLPIYSETVNFFGFKPIICRIQPPEEENNRKWWGYPKDRMEEFLSSSSD